MKKASKPKVERVNRFEGKAAGDFLDIMMGEIFSPSRFFIQLKDPGADKPGYELDDLVDDMEDFYSRLQVMDYCIPLEDLTEGLDCAVNIPAEKNNKWYRAVIKVQDGPAVQVFLHDFGGEATVPNTPEHLKSLLPQFSSCMPAQAIRASLDVKLAPPSDCFSWPEESTERFLQMTRTACDHRGDDMEVGLVAHILGWSREGVLVLQLYDTVSNDSPEGINLGQQLVEEGLAQYLSCNTNSDPGKPYGSSQGTKRSRKVKRMLLSTGYLRTVTFEEEAWITSAEASQLQACWRGYDLLGSSLSRRGKEFQTRQLCKEEEPELWEEMKEEGVLGIFSKAGKEVAEITFFRLVDLMDIMEAVGGCIADEDRDVILEVIVS